MGGIECGKLGEDLIRGDAQSEAVADENAVLSRRIDGGLGCRASDAGDEHRGIGAEIEVGQAGGGADGDLAGTCVHQDNRPGGEGRGSNGGKSGGGDRHRNLGLIVVAGDNNEPEVSVPIAAAALTAVAPSAFATWSIVLVDTRTGEVAVGSATCLTNFDLRANTPVLIPGVGGATAQSAVDSTGQNRVFIRDRLALGVAPDQILAQLAAFDTAHQSRQYGIVD